MGVPVRHQRLLALSSKQAFAFLVDLFLIVCASSKRGAAKESVDRNRKKADTQYYPPPSDTKQRLRGPFLCRIRIKLGLDRTISGDNDVILFKISGIYTCVNNNQTALSPNPPLVRLGPV